MQRDESNVDIYFLIAYISIVTSQYQQAIKYFEQVQTLVQNIQSSCSIYTQNQPYFIQLLSQTYA